MTFNLSEKMQIHWQDSGDEGEEYYTHEGECYKEEDVKEFIKRLKTESHISLEGDFMVIRYSKFKELAGDELI